MKRALKAVVTLLCLGAVLLVVLAILVPALLGYQRYIIVGGSMTGTIAKGSVVYERLTPVSQLKVGDIITFVPPGYTEPVTHRIIAIQQGPGGSPVFQTKGDFNPVRDPWKMSLKGPEQPRYVFHIPCVGYVLAAVAIRKVRMILIGIPAVVIAFSLLWSLWTQAGDDVRRRNDEMLLAEDRSSI